jgi:hypothetical protein
MPGLTQPDPWDLVGDGTVWMNEDLQRSNESREGCFVDRVCIDAVIQATTGTLAGSLQHQLPIYRSRESQIINGR